MLKIYYTIWVDGIQKLKSRPENQGMWKFYSMIFISMAMAMNFVLFMVILQEHIIGFWFYNLNINLTSSSKINSAISFFILFLSLPLLINYLLIFRNKRYERLFTKYKFYDGKYCATYLMISYFSPLIIAIIALLIEEMR
jgi:hypothetical protein